jgi:hypothetical protein
VVPSSVCPHYEFELFERSEVGCAGFASNFFFEKKQDPFPFVFACSKETKGPIFSLRFASNFLLLFASIAFFRFGLELGKK